MKLESEEKLFEQRWSAGSASFFSSQFLTPNHGEENVYSLDFSLVRFFVSRQRNEQITQFQITLSLFLYPPRAPEKDFEKQIIWSYWFGT